MNIRSAQRDDLLSEEPTRVQKALGLAIRMQWWIVLAIMVGAAWLYYARPLRSTAELEEKLARLEAEKKVLSDERDRISRRITWIKDESTSYLELAARDYLDWQKDGEVIVRLAK